jgi:spermidine synthase
LFEIASPPPLQTGRLRLLEPPDSSETQLRGQLIDGTYSKPFILDCGPLRFLHFDLENVQSVMRQDDPDALCLAYTRKMMTFLLFNPDPRRILLVGLGGGSLAKFCYRHLPSARITVLEIDRHVLALRDEFRVPPDDERFHVLHGDGVCYVAHRTTREDVILVDACDRRGLACELSEPGLYSSLRRRLAVGGVLVMNICGDSFEIADHICRIRGVFGKRVIALPVKEDGNLIVLAFRSRLPQWDGAQLDHFACELKQRFGLAFPRSVRRMANRIGAAG